jgi:hypothetical protein
VQCQFTELTVVPQAGRLTTRQRCPTTIPALRAARDAIARPRWVAREEGPLADWLWRNRHGHVETLTGCDPRRNRLIAKDSDKDDSLDAEKLAPFLRGGYLKAVQHPASLQRAVFKQRVLLYHDRVRQRVQEANRVLASLRRHGLFVHEQAFVDPEDRSALLQGLPPARLIAANRNVLWQSYDLAADELRSGSSWTSLRESPLGAGATYPRSPREGREATDPRTREGASGSSAARADEEPPPAWRGNVNPKEAPQELKREQEGVPKKVS